MSIWCALITSFILCLPPPPPPPSKLTLSKDCEEAIQHCPTLLPLLLQALACHADNAVSLLSLLFQSLPPSSPLHRFSSVSLSLLQIPFNPTTTHYNSCFIFSPSLREGVCIVTVFGVSPLPSPKASPLSQLPTLITFCITLPYTLPLRMWGLFFANCHFCQPTPSVLSRLSKFSIVLIFQGTSFLCIPFCYLFMMFCSCQSPVFNTKLSSPPPPPPPNLMLMLYHIYSTLTLIIAQLSIY